MSENNRTLSETIGEKSADFYLLTEPQKKRAIQLALDNKKISEIIAELGVTQYRFWKCKKADPNFEIDFNSARTDAMDDLTDELLTVHDDEPDVQRARLKSDNIKWVAAKRSPKTYGDRIDLNVNQTVDIGGALKEARARALTGQVDKTPIKADKPTEIVDAEFEELAEDSDIFD